MKGKEGSRCCLAREYRVLCILLSLLPAFLKELLSFTLYSGEGLEKGFKKGFLNIEVKRADKELPSSAHWFCPIR